MIALLCKLAAPRLTLLGMVLLVGGASFSLNNPTDTPAWVLVVPSVFLTVNFLAAIVTQPAIYRRGGLLCFHIGLLAIFLLAAIGRLTYHESHIEITQGAAFDAASISGVEQGPWHYGELEKVQFVQGPYTVDYGPSLSRGPTRSTVSIPDKKGGWKDQIVGDDTPLLLNGYRFYTSFNKGFAAILTWIPEKGEPVTGTLHMPSYPLFEYKQDSQWAPPGGEEIKFWLRLDTGYTMEKSWQLDGGKASGLLVVNTGTERVELQPGQEVALSGGQIRYEGLTTWMGYNIFYDPTLYWLFAAAILSVFGLMHHYWTKFAEQPLTRAKVSDEEDIRQQKINVSGKVLQL